MSEQPRDEAGVPTGKLIVLLIFIALAFAAIYAPDLRGLLIEPSLGIDD